MYKLYRIYKEDIFDSIFGFGQVEGSMALIFGTRPKAIGVLVKDNTKSEPLDLLGTRAISPNTAIQ